MAWRRVSGTLLVVLLCGWQAGSSWWLWLAGGLAMIDLWGKKRWGLTWIGVIVLLLAAAGGLLLRIHVHDDQTTSAIISTVMWWSMMGAIVEIAHGDD